MVSKLCKELGLPLLSAKVISKVNGKASAGFYELMQELGLETLGKTEKELFYSELDKIRKCKEWYKLSDYLNLNINFPHPSESLITGTEDELEVFNLNNVIGEMPRIYSTEKYITDISEESKDFMNPNIVEINHQTIPEEVSEKQQDVFPEGGKKTIIVNAYERNYNARNECIKEYGSSCAICSFDFGKFYGKEFDGRIHVHHIKPLYIINSCYTVNPKTDLIPVCPNCHMVLHLKKEGVFSVEDVKKMIVKTRTTVIS